MDSYLCPSLHGFQLLGFQLLAHRQPQHVSREHDRTGRDDPGRWRGRHGDDPGHGSGERRIVKVAVLAAPRLATRGS